MCIAILTTPGKSLTEEVFRRCFNNNSHGAGFAWISPFSGDVEIDKGFMTADGAWRRYQQLVNNGWHNKAMLIHFRLRTVGRQDQENCHPFAVKGGAMIHNGTFWRDPAADKSDSRMLAEIMHNELHAANMKANKDQLDKAFGYNRVAFLFKGGEYYVFGEEFDAAYGRVGQWKDGIWYSNGGWKGAYSSYYGDTDKLNVAPENKRYPIDFDDAAELEEMDRQLWGQPNRRSYT